MRRNRSQTRQRRSHHAISAPKVVRCDCGAEHLAHRACPQCGKYRGHVVVDIVARKEREARRTKRREKELRESGQAVEKEKETEAAAK